MHLITVGGDDYATLDTADGQVVEPFGDVPAAVVDEADVGAVSAAVLTQDGHSGKAYALTGPEALTPRAAAGDHRCRDRARAAVHRAHRGTGPRTLAAAGRGRGDDRHSRELAGHPPPHAYTVTTSVEEILGRPPRSFARWAAEHAGDFLNG